MSFRTGWQAGAWSGPRLILPSTSVALPQEFDSPRGVLVPSAARAAPVQLCGFVLGARPAAFPCPRDATLPVRPAPESSMGGEAKGVRCGVEEVSDHCPPRGIAPSVSRDGRVSVSSPRGAFRRE